MIVGMHSLTTTFPWQFNGRLRSSEDLSLPCAKEKLYRYKLCLVAQAVHLFEPPHGKTTICIGKTKAPISFAVTAKLISAFVFATRIVQFLLHLNPKFQASSMFRLLCSPVCVGPVRIPHCWFSHEAAHFSQHDGRST